MTAQLRRAHCVRAFHALMAAGGDWVPELELLRSYERELVVQLVAEQVTYYCAASLLARQGGFPR